MLQQRLWMIPIANWLGIFAAIACVYLLTQGAPAWWALAWAVGHLFGSIAVSAGLHRYFSHGSFKTTRFWHAVMAVYGTLTVQASPMGWAVTHASHHAHSDTPGDPHHTNLSYIVFKDYREVPKMTWRLKHLVGDSVVAFVHRYALVVIAAWVLVLLAVGAATDTGALPLLFGYLAPLGSTHFSGSMHHVISHHGKTPNDMPWMEWIFPAGGEWMHKYHHDNPRDPRFGGRWWSLDYGWWFICLVRTDSKQQGGAIKPTAC